MDAVKVSGAVVLSVLLGSGLLSGRASAQGVKLNGELTPELRSGDVSEHLFTPDGTRLVYRANRAADAIFELFSVPTDGSGPSVRLNAPLPAGDSVRSGAKVGAGNLVVFVADQNTLGVFELFSVPADASADPTLLSHIPTFVYWLNPAGTEVYYRNSGTPNTLFRVPIDGSAPPSAVATNLNTLLGVLFSSDGSTALLRTFGDLDTERLYSVPADGSLAPIQLHQTQVGNLLQLIRFASDGTHVLFEEVQIEGIFFPNFLFSARLDGGGSAVQLNLTQSYAPGSYVLDASSDEDRVVFQDGAGVYSIAFDGTQLGAFTPDGWSSQLELFETPRLAVRGPDVVFDAFSAAGRALLRAPIDGSLEGVPLFTPNDDVVFSRPEILASGTVVYLASGDSGFLGLFSVPLAGGTPVLLNPPPVANRGARSFQVHPNGLEVAFLSDAATSGKDEFAFPSKAGGPLCAAPTERSAGSARSA